MRRELDPEVRLESLFSPGMDPAKIAPLRAAREFSLTRCSVERRIRGYADTIIVLRVNPEPARVLGWYNESPPAGR